MSAGPGHVMRAIEAAVDADPAGAFTVEDLCRLAFPQAGTIEKKHRVSVIRAMRNFARGRIGMFVYRYRHWRTVGAYPLILFDGKRIDDVVEGLKSREMWLMGDDRSRVSVMQGCWEKESHPLGL